MLSHAASHVGEYAVLRIDLADFFASIAAARVHGILRTAGYPESVAHALTGLTTNAVPAQVLAQIAGRSGDPRSPAGVARLRRRLATPHLPQGAPTSPALANLAAFGVDRRLTGLTAALGLTYTRHADDLTFSGGRREVAPPSRCDQLGSRRLPGKDSNLEFQGQNLASCRLLHPARDGRV